MHPVCVNGASVFRRALLCGWGVRPGLQARNGQRDRLPERILKNFKSIELRKVYTGDIGACSAAGSALL